MKRREKGKGGSFKSGRAVPLETGLPLGLATLVKKTAALSDTSVLFNQNRIAEASAAASRTVDAVGSILRNDL